MARIAITAVFTLNGVVFSSIYARLPAIKGELALSDGRLGLALVWVMVGLLVAQPLAGALVVRRGSRPVVRVAAVAYAATVAPIALADSFVALAASFALLGACNGALDVAMNVQGLTVERALRRPIFSTLHAAFSFGALGGAGAGALIAAAGVEHRAHLLGAAVLGIGLAVLATRPLLADDANDGGRAFALPTRALALIGTVAFCVLLCEGAINDWCAVYLDDAAGASEGLAAAGLAAFSATMGTVRLIGDRLLDALGPVALARRGGLLAALGIGAALALATPATAIAGYALLGIGLASLFPLIVRAAVATGDGAAAVAAASTSGYAGFVVGPPAIGGLAELASLRAALVLVLALCLVVALLAPALAPATRARGERGSTARCPARA